MVLSLPFQNYSQAEQGLRRLLKMGGAWPDNDPGADATARFSDGEDLACCSGFAPGIRERFL
ncbi:hypothetical protein ABIB27_003078 [Arthrobacter sp. UYEF21]